MSVAQQEIERIAKKSNGIVGVYARHLESDQILTHNAEEPFPMASTYKIGMAIKLLQHVEKGDFSLDQMIELTPEDLSPGSGMLTPHLPHPGLALSIYNLLETMMTLSDNTATDKILTLIDGPQAVTEWLHSIGIKGMRIDRPTKSILCDAFGIPRPEGKWSLQTFQDQVKKSTEEAHQTAARTFIADPQDTSTPSAMVSLLTQLHRNELLCEENTALLIDVMKRCQTGEDRINGLLPPKTIVAHKTGSIRRVAINDAGFIITPNTGPIALAIFTKSAKDKDFIKVIDCEQTAAHVARTVYDYFLFSQKTQG